MLSKSITLPTEILCFIIIILYDDLENLIGNDSNCSNNNIIIFWALFFYYYYFKLLIHDVTDSVNWNFMILGMSELSGL